jgi:hypothetical protein
VKVRIRFTKQGKVRWTSHRDVARIWERALRRAGVPVAYTEGFSPRPRLSFGLALPTGYESDAEYLDVDLLDPIGPLVDEERPTEQPGPDRRIGLDELPDRFSACLPGGFAATAVVPVEPGAGSLQEIVTSCSWEITLVGLDASRVAEAADAALAATTLPLVRTRKGRETLDDLRPGVLALSVAPPTQEGRPVLLADLATQPRALRPSELLAACFADVAEPLDITHGVRRTHQWIDCDGARREPIPVPATSRPLPSGVWA